MLLNIGDPTLLSLALTLVAVTLLLFTTILAIILCGGKKKPPKTPETGAAADAPLPMGEAPPAAEGGAEPAGAKSVGGKLGKSAVPAKGEEKKAASVGGKAPKEPPAKGKIDMDTVPKGEYGTLRAVDPEMKASVRK